MENGIIYPILIERSNVNYTTDVKPQHRVDNNVNPWPKGNTLIIGDSILYGVQEARLTKYKAKVRVNVGARVDDIYDYIAPLLKKIPTNVILHIGSNDSVDKSANQIYSEIVNLKSYIKKVLPKVNVILSCPVIRADNISANFISLMRHL